MNILLDPKEYASILKLNRISKKGFVRAWRAKENPVRFLPKSFVVNVLHYM